jgi:hypothetical protein
MKPTYPRLPPSLTKGILETVKKGDIEAVKNEADAARASILQCLHEQGFTEVPKNCLAVVADEQHKQNGIFYATLIKDDE